jgi:PatG C-terminal
MHEGSTRSREAVGAARDVVEAGLNEAVLATAVDLRPSGLSGVRNIVEVIFSFTDRATDVVEKQFLRVDVTEEFPLLVTRLSPYYGL